MKRRTIFVVFIVLDLCCGIAAIAISNQTIVMQTAMNIGKKHLFELGAVHENLQAHYLALALDHIEPKARAAGFVAVADPRYIRQDTTVGFLSH